MNAGNHIAGDADIGFANFPCDHVDDTGINQQTVERDVPQCCVYSPLAQGLGGDAVGHISVRI
ncbi:hypothetical protein SRABI106_01677 [Rahnella aquatilis]|nr:hypothetical protein SRABI106_01677 [Rahnella aquatilis]